MTALALRPKNNFKAVKNRKRGGYVDRHQVRSIDQNLIATHIQTMMTTVNEVSKDKTMVTDDGVFSLFVSLPNSIGNLIHNGAYFQTTAAYVYANERLRMCLYASVLFCSPSPLFSSENYTEKNSVNIGDYSPL